MLRPLALILTPSESPNSEGLQPKFAPELLFIRQTLVEARLARSSRLRLRGHTSPPAAPLLPKERFIHISVRPQNPALAPLYPLNLGGTGIHSPPGLGDVGGWISEND